MDDWPFPPKRRRGLLLSVAKLPHQILHYFVNPECLENPVCPDFAQAVQSSDILGFLSL